MCRIKYVLPILLLLLPMRASAAPVDHIVDFTKAERDEIALVVMSEANAEPMVGKVAVVATIFNRARINETTIHSIVTDPNQYSSGWKHKVSDECYQAIDIYCECPELFPEDMLYFRTGHYHGFAEDYTVIGSHYFSTASPIQEESEEEQKVCLSVYTTLERYPK